MNYVSFCCDFNQFNLWPKTFLEYLFIHKLCQVIFLVGFLSKVLFLITIYTINWVWYKNQNYSSPDGDYLQRIYNIIIEKHLQSCEQYNISVFQKIWDFLFNDPVIVNWGKIHTSQQSNFEILNFETYNLPYDWASISHFRSKAYRAQKSVGHTIESNVS